MRFGFFGLAALALAVLASPAAAQSFDCGKAHVPLDRAICASPDLRRLDDALAAAYVAALARTPDAADAIRAAERAWAEGRTVCLHGAAADEACLVRAYNQRIAALAPPPEAALPTIAPAAATLDRTTFPTAGETDVMLRVATAGRFAITAHSATGTALQLVDMLTGPSPREGWPGKADGRIDALLDVGTYKLRAVGAAGAAGQTALAATGFAEAAPPVLAPGYAPATLQLRDLQVQALWLVVGRDVAFTRVEAAGRSLRALKLWRDGRDLAEIGEQVAAIAPQPAHPLTDIVLSGRLSPGTYLIAAYGGPALPWADGAPDQPLYLRTGRSTDLLAGGATGRVGPFGSEAFAVPPNAAQALLRLPQSADAVLQVFDGAAESDEVMIGRTQREPAVLLDLPEKPKQERSVVLRAAPGQDFALRVVAAGQNVPDRPGRYWFAAAEDALGGDEAPAAAALFRINKDGTGTAIGSAGVPEIGPAQAWRTRFNYRGETTLLFRVAAPVTVAVRAEGVALTARIATLDGAVMNATGNGTAATHWALSPAWYALHLGARPDAVGILDLTLGPPGLVPPTPEPSHPAAPVLPLGEHAVEADSGLRLFVDDVPGFVGGLIARPAPLDLGQGPVVATLAPGAGAAVAARAPEAGVLVLRDVAGGPPIEQRPVAKGEETTLAFPAADQTRTLAFALLPPQTAPIPSPAPPEALPGLQDGTPRFLDLARDRTARLCAQCGAGRAVPRRDAGPAGDRGADRHRLRPHARVRPRRRRRAQHAAAALPARRQLPARRDRARVGGARRRGGHGGAAGAGRGAGCRAKPCRRRSARRAAAPPFRCASRRPGRYHLDLLGDGRDVRRAARRRRTAGRSRPPRRLTALDAGTCARHLSPDRAAAERRGARGRPAAPRRGAGGASPGTGRIRCRSTGRSVAEWREPPARDDAARAGYLDVRARRARARRRCTSTATAWRATLTRADGRGRRRCCACMRGRSGCRRSAGRALPRGGQRWAATTG